MSRIMFALWCLLVGGSVFQGLHADSYREIKKEREFYKKIEKAPFSIGMFYVDDREDRAWQRTMDQQKRDFRRLSKSELYQQADFRFIGIDVGRQGLHELDTDFTIETLPSFILFNYGRPLRDDANNLITLVGFKTEQEIKNFINEHLRTAIEKYIQDVAERRAEQRAWSAAYLGWPYYGYGWPYYGGYGYGYGYPGVGFGFSVGY